MGLLTPLNGAMPSDPPAERAVIGCVLTDPAAMAKVSVLVSVSDFHDAALGEVYSVAKSLHDRGAPVDVCTVSAALPEGARPEGHVGGKQAYVAELAAEVATGTNVEYFARRVSLAARKRDTILARRVALQDAIDDPVDDVSQKEWRATELAWAGVDGARRAAQGDRGKRIYCGLSGVDDILRGFRPGQVSLIGARPSIGKTSLLLAILMGAARAGHHCGFVSLEVSEDELRYSLLAIEGGLDRRGLEEGVEDTSEITRAADRISRWPGSLRVSCPTRPPTAKGLVRMCAQFGDCDLVALDYIQRVSTEPKENKVSALESLSLAVCEFARVSGAHFLATAQLNRNVEGRGKNAAPSLADLKGSGQFEQDAHNVLLLHRPNKDSQDADKPDIKASLLVAKQRNGPTGFVRLGWDGPSVRFHDAPEWRP